MLKPRVHNCPKKFWLQKEVSESWTVNSNIAPNKNNNKQWEISYLHIQQELHNAFIETNLTVNTNGSTTSAHNWACYCNGIYRELTSFSLLRKYRQRNQNLEYEILLPFKSPRKQCCLAETTTIVLTWDDISSFLQKTFFRLLFLVEEFLFQKPKHIISSISYKILYPFTQLAVAKGNISRNAFLSHIIQFLIS